MTDYLEFRTNLEHPDTVSMCDEISLWSATIERTESMLQRAGFRLNRVHEDSFVMRFADGSALLRHSFIKLGFLDGWRQAVESESERQQVFARLE